MTFLWKRKSFPFLEKVLEHYECGLALLSSNNQTNQKYTTWNSLLKDSFSNALLYKTATVTKKERIESVKPKIMISFGKKGAIIAAQKIFLFIVALLTLATFSLTLCIFTVREDTNFLLFVPKIFDRIPFSKLKINFIILPFIHRSKLIVYNSHIVAKRHYKPSPSIFSNKFMNKAILNQIAKGYSTTHNRRLANFDDGTPVDKNDVN
ncbi:hypothetical protein RFI_05448 [Reticulomyxa filosa]|uniref:Uncharacterized protein n=1 Tax=Reticulomyxa filosa TaxID=46433 RepID=X6P0A3_RETFI|nr:hypothetical protein RFI_05448 [Reticulomyxa filosa]|eukprot:ETO31671.1 hypothetical protein RFI_05448 [Reticulomyxa filosa]